MIKTTASKDWQYGNRTAALLLFFAMSGASAQEPAPFDDIEAADELQDIALAIGNDDIDAEGLNRARSRASKIEAAAVSCAASAGAARARLEERFEAFKDVDPDDASAESLSQRQGLRSSLDDAIATQAQCDGIAYDARTIVSRISGRQNELSQQFLSSRTQSVVAMARELPQRMRFWPAQIREHLNLKLIDGVTPAALLWYLILAGLAAAVLGLLIRQRFFSWYGEAGGNNAPAQMKYLFPKPLARYAPLWLQGLALYLVLAFTMPDASSSLVAVRVALAIFGFGLACVIIDWSTGQLSPSADIKGLIPDHVKPLRLRLRLFALAFCISYVVLGNEWLAVRTAQPMVTGRASMIFIVAIGLFGVLAYLPRIPGLKTRYRPLCIGGVVAIVLALAALATGYQNLAGYIVQGVTRSALALYVLWIFLWLFYVGFNYLLEQRSRTAAQVRSSLGISESGSGTGVGFMQLIADLALWIAIIVYLIYVWDTTGSTLDQLKLSLSEGWNLGGVSLVPKNILGGILVFALLVVVIGWIRRWIDRRWLQRIVIERGARDAILTLFGYIAFVLAVLLSLKAASVDLTGLAIISGALALGLGFGLQGIANNFVSGLILLFERPIRAGDFVTIGETEGFVRSIRIRATEIETLDNQNVLVPNSELVSGRVTNWVLRDTHGRLQVKVGVAYGSDVQRVREILEAAGHAHSEVITDGRAPAPRALFIGFGDSSLDFELRVRVQRIERRFSVLSDLNFEIDRAFREAGIVIPFPQRDLHIVSYPEAAEIDAADVEKDSGKTVSRVDQITRSHNAELVTESSAEEVWAAITEIDLLKRWLVRDGILQARIGGEVSLDTRDGYAVKGRVDVFMPGRRLRVAVLPAAMEEPLATGPITIELVVGAHRDRTRLTVTVDGVPGSEDWEEYYRLSVDRWREALADLRSEVLRR